MIEHATETIYLDARHYAKNSSFQIGVAKEAVPHLALNGTENILDVGCGAGDVTYHLSTLTRGDVFAVDPDQGMVDLASARFGTSRLIFSKAAGETFSFDRRFERITCFSALHWARNARQFLQNIKNHLATDGIAVILTYTHESHYFHPLHQVLAANPQWKLRATFYSAQAYTEMARQVGFTEISAESSHCLAHYDDFASLRTYVMGWLALFAEIPNQDLDSYFSLVEKEMISTGFKKQDGSFVIPYRKLLMVLR